MERAHEAQPPCACNLPTCVACAAARQGGHARLLMPATHAGHMDETESQGSQSSQERKTSVHEVPVPAGLFIDANAMKERIRNAVLREEYDVAQFYHKEGIWQAIARHGHFEKLTLFVIAMNALWIWVDTDLNSAEVLINAEPVFQIAEHCFCVYFSFEWTVRFKSFRVKRHGLRDGWFVFDSCLVFMMVAETWVMTSIMLMSGGGGGGGLGNASILRMARLMRLSRMARMARLLRALPELLMLIKGIAAAMRSVLMSLILLGIITYVFGIAFKQLVGDAARAGSGRVYFGTVATAMHTLLLEGALLDGTGSLVKALSRESLVYVVVLYFYVMLAALTVMNMLVGVLCEVVSDVNATEKDQARAPQVESQLRTLLPRSLDANCDGVISREEFMKIGEFPNLCRFLQEVGVDVMNLVDNIDFIFAAPPGSDDMDGDRTLTFREFVDTVLSLRGCNSATMKDIVTVRKVIRGTFQRLRDALRATELPRKPSISAPAPVDLSSWAGNPTSPCSCMASTASWPTSPQNLASPRSSCRPCGGEFDETEGKLGHVRVVDALVTAQAELQAFLDALTLNNVEEMCLANCGTGDADSRNDFTSIIPGSIESAPLSPRRSGWVPGALSLTHDDLAAALKAISGGLQVLRIVQKRSAAAGAGPEDGALAAKLG
mmetsp:Transcript_95663/g.275643  ORF Transcript_95663/g.275643 Transcript_95663/m.275643 type:complete len:663 (+) Transcript_95663:105-2093(+)